MPSGKVHDLITAATTPVVGFVAYKITGDYINSTIIVSAFVFASLMFNGDLDIVSRPYRRWSLLRFIWKPYQKIFEHRSIWTHGIIIGTLVRLIWISPLIFLVYKFFPLSFYQLDWLDLLLIFIGLELGNTIHTASDKLVSAI